jgi:uncharacterized protein YkwD
MSFLQDFWKWLLKKPNPNPLPPGPNPNPLPPGPNPNPLPPGPNPNPLPPGPNPSPPPPVSDFHSILLDDHNQERASRGDSPLKIHDKLNAAAQGHSDHMVSVHIMNHEGIGDGTPWQRITKAGYTYTSAGENIAMGYQSEASVMKGWMNSPGHRRNILGDWQNVGFGMTVDSHGQKWWTACFANPQGMTAAGFAENFSSLSGVLVAPNVKEPPLNVSRSVEIRERPPSEPDPLGESGHLF